MQKTASLKAWRKQKKEDLVCGPSHASSESETSNQSEPMDLTQDMRSELLEEWRVKMTTSMSDEELIWHASRLPPLHAQNYFHRVIREEARQRDLLSD